MVKSRFNPASPKRTSIDGWRASKIGAFLASFGGDIGLLRIMWTSRVKLLM